MTENVESSIPGAIDGIRAAIADILDRHEDCGREVSRIIRLLAILERALRAEVPSVASPPEPRFAEVEPSRRYQPKRYEVQLVGNEEMLAEFRSGSEFPFRCPKRILDAVVSVLETADRPLSFVEILESATARLKAAAPDYQLRVCLRFLASPEIGVIRRQRARFAACGPSSVSKPVRAAWKKLTKADIRKAGPRSLLSAPEP